MTATDDRDRPDSRSGGDSGQAREQEREQASGDAVAELGRLFDGLSLPGLSFQALLEAQRKDIDALKAANREAYGGMAALVARRNEILAESLAQWHQTLMPDAAAAPDAADADAAGSGGQLRAGLLRAAVNFRELAEIDATTRARTWKTLQDRFSERLVGLQGLLTPGAGAATDDAPSEAGTRSQSAGRASSATRTGGKEK